MSAHASRESDPFDATVEARHPSPTSGGTPAHETFDRDLELLRHKLEQGLSGVDGAQPRPKLGRFPLLRKLGAGGMSTVYIGRDERLDRYVAIKLLRGASSSQAMARLEREAQAMARLAHPNVVRVYEIGDVDNVPFIVMELVEGVTLRAWLGQTQRTLDEIVEVFAAAARGLAAAHDKGLVHRDFKPDNVMVADDGRVLVMDFGLARGEFDRPGPTQADAQLSDNAVELTATGAILGTPAYMAPEQFLGEVADARTDQFCFSVALWEAIHGQRPFSGSSFAALSSAVIEGARAPSSADVPRHIRRVLERGLEADPDARWPSMAALVEVMTSSTASRRRPTRLLAGVAGLALLGTLTTLSVVRTLADQPQAASVDAKAQISDPELKTPVVLDRTVNLSADFAASVRCIDPGPADGPSSIGHCELLRSIAKTVVEDPAAMAWLETQGKLIPEVAGSEVVSVRIYGVGLETVPALLGLRDGDTFAGINGNLPQSFDLAALLETGDEFEIEFLRRGVDSRLRLSIVDELSGPPTGAAQLRAASRVVARAQQSQRVVENNAQIAAGLRCVAEPHDGGPDARTVHDCELRRDLVEGLLADPAQLSELARAVPTRQDGIMKGFKLFTIAPDSIIDMVGVHNGDMIERINGRELNSIDVAMEVYGGLHRATKFEVELSRKRGPLLVRIRIVDALAGPAANLSG
jgi:serine/threonine protein kinase